MEWTGQVYADTPTVSAQVRIEAPPERVWTLVSDIFLMPELSSELQEVTWLDGGTGPAVGHRFTGRNAHPAMGEWETVSTVTECDPPHRFAWLLALTAAMAVATLVLLGAYRLQRVLGERGMIAVERLMGLVLTALAVQMLLDGLRNFVASVAHGG